MFQKNNYRRKGAEREWLSQKELNKRKPWQNYYLKRKGKILTNG